jgi:uncharacterized protein with GYD domain
MLFVVTMRWPVDKTPDIVKRAAENLGKEPQGVKVTSYLLLGRCQAVNVIEAPDEKSILQIHTPYLDVAECDWAPAMVAGDVLKSFG